MEQSHGCDRCGNVRPRNGGAHAGQLHGSRCAEHGGFRGGYGALLPAEGQNGPCSGRHCYHKRLGGIYPKGIKIGSVREVLTSDGEANAIISPSVDFVHIEEVFIITGNGEG